MLRRLVLTLRRQAAREAPAGLLSDPSAPPLDRDVCEVVVARELVRRLLASLTASQARALLRRAGLGGGGGGLSPQERIALDRARRAAGQGVACEVRGG